MSNKLYIGNLPSTATQESLEEVFGNVGAVNSVNLVRDRDTGQSKGFAFVEMTRDDDADKAIHDLDGSLMGELEIKVNVAKPMRTRGGGSSHRDRSS